MNRLAGDLAGQKAHLEENLDWSAYMIPALFTIIPRDSIVCQKCLYTFAPRKGVYTMIIVNVKENESIEKALKRFKKKFDKTGAVRELRARQAFTKPSIVRRAQVIKAAYKQNLRDEEMK